MVQSIFAAVGGEINMKWNPWHGCHKLSEGCKNCYVYRMVLRHEKDASKVKLNVSSFREPVLKNRKGEYKHPSGTTYYTCFTSDFFLEDADEWRKEAWTFMKERSDCRFFFITKRIDRFRKCIPDDWGDGYDNVMIAVTTENQRTADYRLPIYSDLPIKHKGIMCEPLLERIDLTKYLDSEIELVSVGGESGLEARICDYEGILDIRRQCVNANVPFDFHQTGARLLKDGKVYNIPKKLQGVQARKAGIDFGMVEK